MNHIALNFSSPHSLSYDDMATKGETQGRSEGGHSISRDDIFDILSSHRRRYALRFMRSSNGPFELGEIAEQVAAWENDKSRAEVSTDERHRVYTSLQQVHLPAMDAAGIINCNNGTVRMNNQAAEVEIYMDIVPGDSIPWAYYYLGLASVCAGVVGAVWNGLFPSFIPTPFWAGLIVTVLFVSAAVHVWQSHQSRHGIGEMPPEVE